MSKILVVLTFLSVFIQIIFSFYYSGNIVNQNNHLDEYKQKYQRLTLEIAEIKKQLATKTSLENFFESTTSAKLNFNTKSINISNF